MPWSVSDYNTNPALNTAINGVDISEGAAAAGYNNALRQMMADIKTWVTTQQITLPVSISNGGTGQTTASAALAALGGLGIAYRGLPQQVFNASFDFDQTMGGGHIRWTGGTGTATIQPNSLLLSEPMMVINDGSGVLTITRGAGVTLIWAGVGTNANRALAVGGAATIIPIATNRLIILGVGLS